jgi:hypothetical protein
MELFMRSLSVVFITAFVLLLSACGGEGSGDVSDSGGDSDSGGVPGSGVLDITQFIITSTSGDGGSISPVSVTVDENKTTSFTLTPNPDYAIDSVTGCDGRLEGNTYSTDVVTQDCVVSARFNLKSYTVNASAGQGGSISPAEQTVIHGETTSFTLTPNPDYAIDSVTGCNGSLEGDTYSTDVVTQDCAVSALFKLKSYAVTATAGQGGGITPAKQTVIHGETATLTLAPDTGYAIDSVTGCDGSLEDSLYTIARATQDCTVSASFNKTYTVTASAEGGGNITPLEQTVIHGETATLTLAPDTGYAIDSVTGCDGSLEGDTYSTDVVTQDCAVSALFKLKSYAVTATAGQGGGITPAKRTVIHGDKASFKLTPNADYAIDSVIGCDGSLEDSLYTIASATQDCTVSASFNKTYTVTASAEGGGNITPLEQTVIHGETATLTLAPDTGYAIDSVTGCDGILNGTKYSTDPVTDNCEVSASFNQVPIANAGSDQTVFANSTVTLDGSASTDLEDDASAQPKPVYYYSWEQTDATNIIVTLNDINSVNPSFEAPSVTATTVLQFTLTVTDSNDDSSTDDVSITVIVPVKLNDTGITKCSSGSCENTGEDGEYGRDAQNVSTLKKVGAGRAGFDFTKLNANGEELEDQTSTGSCVQDNHTGLVWEVKTTSNKDDRYTWYNTNNSTNGGAVGTDNGGANTQAFVASVNSVGLCGATNWRLPNKNELVSIVDFSASQPAIDSEYFPNTISSWYWSSSPNASYNDLAWIVYFDVGYGGNSYKSSGRYVRLVRGGQ